MVGRPASTTDEQRVAMAKQHQAGESISALALDFGISRASVMRIVKPSEEALTGAHGLRSANFAVLHPRARARTGCETVPDFRFFQVPDLNKP